MIRTVMLSCVVFLLLGCSEAREEYDPGSLEAALQEQFGAARVEVSLVLPDRRLEVVLRSEEFEGAERAALIELTERAAQFVFDRLAADADLTAIAVEAVMERTEDGIFYQQKGIRGVFPTASFSAPSKPR